MDNYSDNTPGMPLGRPLGMPPETPDDGQATAAPEVPSHHDDTMETPRHVVPTALPRRQPKRKGGRTWLYVLAALLIAGGIVGGICYLLSQKDEPEVVVVDDDEVTDVGEEDTDEPQEHATAPQLQREPVRQNRQLTLRGDADGFPLTLTLEMGQDNRVSGTYTNESTGTETAVSGSTTGGEIRLTGNGYTLRIVPDGHIFTGTLSRGGAPDRELHLTELRDNR